MKKKCLLLFTLLFMINLSGCKTMFEMRTDDENNDDDGSTPVQYVDGMILTNDDLSTTNLTKFTTDDADIYAIGTVQNANNTTVSAEWYYYDTNELISEVEFDVTSDEFKFIISINSMWGGFPEGDYAVDVYLDEVLLNTIEFEVEYVSAGTTPSYLVGFYSFESAIGDVPTNIVSHSLDIRSDGTYTEDYVWSSKTMSSTSTGSVDGSWGFQDGSITFTNQSGYAYTCDVVGQRIECVEIYWTDITMYFGRPWSDD